MRPGSGSSVYRDGATVELDRRSRRPIGVHGLYSVTSTDSATRAGYGKQIQSTNANAWRLIATVRERAPGFSKAVVGSDEYL